jgi:hypothetical protein
MSAIPTATVSRLVTYLRIVSQLEQNGVERTSSDDLAREAHVSAFQVRKDLAYFGRFGTRGAGYSVATAAFEPGAAEKVSTWLVTVMAPSSSTSKPRLVGEKPTSASNPVRPGMPGMPAFSHPARRSAIAARARIEP